MRFVFHIFVSLHFGRKESKVLTLLPYVLNSPVFPPYPSSSPLLCTHSLLHTSMQLLQLHVPLCLHLLQPKAYTRNQRYLLPNSDYEIDNSTFSVSSGIPTTFLLVLLSHTMRIILRLDLTFLSKPILIVCESTQYVYPYSQINR